MYSERHEWDWPPSRRRKRTPTVEIIPPDTERPKLEVTVALVRPARTFGQRLLDAYIRLLVITLKALAGAVWGIILVAMVYLMKALLSS
jgi:hypothetical protein